MAVVKDSIVTETAAKAQMLGHLREGGSSVWIEDAETGQPVTEKIAQP